MPIDGVVKVRYPLLVSSIRERPLPIDAAVNVHGVPVVPRLMKQELAPVVLDPREVYLDVDARHL